MAGISIRLLRGCDVKPLLDMEEVMKAVEEAFRLKSLGGVQMPPKLYLFYKRYDGDLRLMPSYIEEMKFSSVKVVSVHPRNRSRGLPTVIATILLIDPESGSPLCIMDGTWITAMRTGAAGGVAARHLAKRDSRVLGIIGAGTQASTQLMALSKVLDLEEVRVYDKSPTSAKNFVEASRRSYPQLSFTIAEDARGVVEGCDVLVTLTPSRSPVVMNEWVKEGLHINAFGADAPGKEELDPQILKRAKIIVDDREQAIHAGELNVPFSKNLLSEQDLHAEIGDVITGQAAGRTSDEEITVFCSTGLAIQDLVAARLVYLRAVERGIGVKINLMG